MKMYRNKNWIIIFLGLILVGMIFSCGDSKTDSSEVEEFGNSDSDNNLKEDENLEMASYVHSFLTHTAQSLWDEHKRKLGIKCNADRRAYLAGVMTGFDAKLVAQTNKDAQEGLVWVRNPEQRNYYRRRHPHVRTVRRQSSSGTAAHIQGHKDGQNIVLHRGVEGGPSCGPTKLLGERC